MALHTDLKIYKTGTSLLALAFNVQKNMERGYKRGIGEQITKLCTDMLVLMAQANACRGEARAQCIRDLLEKQHVTTILLRVCHDMRPKPLISTSTWASSMELLDGIGKQGGGWLKSAKAPAA